MQYYLVRSFDHAGYYETRLLLTGLGLLVAIWHAAGAGDRRYLVMFGSGVFFQAVLEASLLLLCLRGGGYELSVFGVRLPAAGAVLFRGCAEGGILALMSFWFADLFLNEGPGRREWLAFAAACALIVGMAVVVGVRSAGQPVSSSRPLFAPVAITLNEFLIATFLFLLWCKGGQGFRYLGYYYLGALLYAVLTFEPMHWLGARTIAVRTAAGELTPAGPPAQVGLTAWSYVAEIAGGKIHYFVVPFVLGWVRFSGGR